MLPCRNVARTLSLGNISQIFMKQYFHQIPLQILLGLGKAKMIKCYVFMFEFNAAAISVEIVAIY